MNDRDNDDNDNKVISAVIEKKKREENKATGNQLLHDFPIVGIGASAGGLEALEMFFGNLPVQSGAAYVVIQHLSPHFKSFMPEILQRSSGMKIHFAEDRMEIAPDCIYVLPPKQNLTITNGCFQLQEIQRSLSPNRPIDLFFTSLAQYRYDLAIAVILSGTGSDGSEGIRSIHDFGGKVLVQDPETAKFDGMPRNAIATNYVDIISPPDILAEKLISLFGNRFANSIPFSESEFSGHYERILKKIFKLLEKKHEVDFSLYKSPTITRRLAKQMEMHRCTNIGKFYELLQDNPQFLMDLYQDLLIGVTQFFRDQEAFEILELQIIPQLMLHKIEDEEIRIWVPASASGEEAYSIAILFHNYQRTHKKNYKIKIIATDIDERAISVATEGIFSSTLVEKMRPEFVTSYFCKKDNDYQVIPEVRKTILFARHNIIKDPPFTKMDLVSCRNLLIYFGEEAQSHAMEFLYFSLKNEGYLFLGPSESVGKFEKGYSVVNQKWKFFQKLRDAELFNNSTLNFPKKDFSRQTFNNGPKWNPRFLGSENNFQNDLRLSFEDLINRFVPAGVLVNEDLELFHIFGDGGKYLYNRPGPASNNLRNMLSHQLILTIILTIQRIKKDSTSVSKLVTDDGNSGKQLIISIDPLNNNKNNNASHYLITFSEPISTSESANTQIIENAIKTDTDHGLYADKIISLELELQMNKENLQSIIEELETTNEELQSTNEELMASNEELQSTNEELHSVNEELYTVNTEYQNKIDELTQMTNDEDNFLKATDIGTIFLSQDLTIRKFTPTIAKAFNLLPQDIGRPITHITHNLLNVDLIGIVVRVLRTKNKEIFEVKSYAGHWFLAKALPYQTFQGVNEGVILTFTDIDAIKQAESFAEGQEKLARALIDNIPAQNFITDADGRINYVSASYTDFTGHKPTADIGSIWEQMIHPTDRERVVNTLQEACRKRKGFAIMFRQKRADGIYRKFVGQTQTIFSKNQEFVGLVGSSLDISDTCECESESENH